MMPPFVVFSTNRIAHFVEVSLYLFYLAQQVKLYLAGGYPQDFKNGVKGMSGDIISISTPPFPDFIEGNYRKMRKGQSHVDRKNLGFFDLIAVKKGCLFLEEDDRKYEIKENEMFILLPDRHHCSWKPCQEDTEFYWLHFYTTA